jgi:hypothetical protein
MDMKRMTFVVTALVFAGVTLSTFAFAANDLFNASRTFEFDPDHTGCPVAYWKQGIGEKDSNCKTDFGLRLEKNCPLATNASAGAVLNGLKGVVVQAGDVLGYDLKDGSPCEAGSPRFNVSYTIGDVAGFSFVGGCANADPGDVTAGSEPGWQRIQFQLQDPTDAFPIVPVGAVLESVVLIVDDPGQYTLDNIRFRDQFADKPGASGPLPTCP